MMKRWMAVLGIVFLCSPVVRAEDPVYFADANLKAVVEWYLGKTDPTPTDMLGLTSLVASSNDITDLTGLEYATNLWLLDLGSNHQISDISPLVGLTNLTHLELSSNQISDLSPLAGLTNLTNLELSSNQISDISPLVGLTNLSRLWLGDNPLNQEACNVHIPQIRENNPGVQIMYDPCIGAVVPRVVGMTQAEAEAALIDAGFIVGDIWWGPSDLPEGTVFAQDPAGGAMAPPGSAVDLICSQAGGGSTVPGADCLIAHWKLDETSGDVIFDSTGQNDGVTYGEPLWQPAGGRIGGALQFDGVDDYAELPLGPVINSLTDSTFTTWVNWSGGSDGQRIFDFGGGQINMSLTPCGGGAGRMCFAIAKAGVRSYDQATAPQALATGWHHVAVTIDAAGQTYRLYLDGQVVATKTEAQYTPSSLGDTTQNWLGRSQSSADPYFHGSLDDFRIYGCALSAAEVAQLTAEVPPDPSLLAWWKLDETWGSTVFDSASQSDGVAYGGPLWQPAGGKIGGALQFDGLNDYAQLPIGSLIGSLTDSTFATWVNWSGTGGDWQRVFDFGSTASVNMFFTPCSSQTGSMRFAITNAGESGQDRVTAAQALGTGWRHVAVTIDAASQTYLLYVDGRVIAGKTAGQYTPSSLGHTTRNWLGRSQWPADPYFHGSLDDLRIYNRALTAAEVARLAGAAGVGGSIIWVSDAHQTLGAATVPDDQGWVDLLRSEGYNVDDQLPSTPGTGYWRTLDAAKLATLEAADLIIISRDADSQAHANDATEVAQWNGVKTPLILLNVYVARSNRWLWLNSTTIGARQAYFTAKAVDPTHPVFAGVNLDNQNRVTWLDQSVYPGYSSYISYTGAGNGKIIAVRPDNNYVLIAEWAAGLPFYSSSSQTPGDKRMLFSAGTEQTADTGTGWGVCDLTAEGKKMFLNAVAYMIGAASPGSGGEAPTGASAIAVENFSFERPGTAKVKGWDGACADLAWTGLVYDIPGWRSDSPGL